MPSTQHIKGLASRLRQARTPREALRISNELRAAASMLRHSVTAGMAADVGKARPDREKRDVYR